MIVYSRRFTLKQRDFASGKMLSPPREFWVNCDCCGKLIVQGVEMTNGDKIGVDCYELVSRVPFAMKSGAVENLFQMFGTTTRVQEYALACADA